MDSDDRIDQVASERSQPCQSPVLVRTRKPRVAEDIGHQDRDEFPGLTHDLIAEASRSPVAGGSAWLDFHAALIDTRRAADPAFGS
jgi:hypothetical protein